MRHPLRHLVAALIAALVLGLSALALAQSTGSSFGGGSWSESGGGGGSSGGWSGSSSGAYASTPQGNGIELSPGMQCLVAGTWLLVVYGLYRGFRWLTRPTPVAVGMTQLVIDARARRFVQARLDTLAKSGRTGTAAGRAELLAATAKALRDTRLAWIYAAARSVPPAADTVARTELQRFANEARAGYHRELLRAADGTTRVGNAPALAPKEHEGQGVVLVTLIVAARVRLADVRADRTDEIDALLSQLEGLTAAQLVALEVVWTPAAEDDRMSTAELEARYPGLTPLTTGLGRVFCGHCRGPFAGELERCPHCGAPRAEAMS